MRYAELASLIGSAATGALSPWAADVLRSAESGRSPVEAVLHPLGFVCLPLERDGEFGVCLHLWPPEAGESRTAFAQIHCHSWELLSFVLYGRIGNQRIRLVDGDEYRVFEVTSREDGDDVRPTDRTVGTVPEPVAVHEAGETYRLPSGVFHRTVVDGGVGTVALGRSVADGRDRALGPPHQAGYRMRRRPCDGRELSRIIRSAAAQLERRSLR